MMSQLVIWRFSAMEVAISSRAEARSFFVVAMYSARVRWWRGRVLLPVALPFPPDSIWGEVLEVISVAMVVEAKVEVEIEVVVVVDGSSEGEGEEEERAESVELQRESRSTKSRPAGNLRSTGIMEYSS